MQEFTFKLDVFDPKSRTTRSKKLTLPDLVEPVNTFYDPAALAALSTSSKLLVAAVFRRWSPEETEDKEAFTEALSLHLAERSATGKDGPLFVLRRRRMPTSPDPHVFPFSTPVLDDLPVVSESVLTLTELALPHRNPFLQNVSQPLADSLTDSQSIANDSRKLIIPSSPGEMPKVLSPRKKERENVFVVSLSSDPGLQFVVGTLACVCCFPVCAFLSFYLCCFAERIGADKF